MTATDTPPTTEPVLGYYLGMPVVGATVEIANTGSGLEKGLDMPDEALDDGVYDVVLRCRLAEHKHKIDPDRREVTLVNRLKAETATFPALGETAAQALKRAEDAIERRKDGVDERQLTLDDDGRGGEPQTVGRIAEDVLEVVGQLEDGATNRAEWTKELDRLAKREGKDAVVEFAAALDIETDSLTISELVDAIVDYWAEHGRDDGEGDDA